MKISVVIPLYNKASHISNTIQHVLNQSFQDFEIIVVNDGSTDGSEKIVAEMNDPRIRLINQDNGGVSLARNRGVKESNSDLIAFLDADDEWYDDYLQTMYNLFLAYPSAVAYSSNYSIVEGNEKYMLSFAGIDEGMSLIDNYFLSSMSYTPVWTSATIVKKDIFVSLGGFPAGCRMCEDLDLWCRLACCGDIAYINESHAVYLRNAVNMASKSSDTSCYFPFLDSYVNYKSNVSPQVYESICKYVEKKRFQAVSYALLVARNPKETRRIIKKIKGETKNKKKMYGYYFASFLPQKAIDLYIDKKRRGCSK